MGLREPAFGHQRESFMPNRISLNRVHGFESKFRFEVRWIEALSPVNYTDLSLSLVENLQLMKREREIWSMFSFVYLSTAYAI